MSYVNFGNATLVARGSNGVGANLNVFHAMSHSEDGQVWTAVEIEGVSDFSNLNAAAFGNGRFVAISSYGDIATSTDGETWTLAVDALAIDSDHPNDFWHVAFGNGVFLIMGSHEGVCSTWSSTDGQTWSAPRPTGVSFGSAPTRLDFVDGTVYCFDGALGISEDSGVTWAVAPITVNGTSVTVQSLVRGGGLYVMATDAGFVASSPDMTTWTVRATVEMTHQFTQAAFLNNTFVLLMGRSILTSTDGIRWTETKVGSASDTLAAVAFDGTNLVAVGDPGLTVIGSWT
jgi:hypothetical protein